MFFPVRSLQIHPHHLQAAALWSAASAQKKIPDWQAMVSLPLFLWHSLPLHLQYKEQMNHWSLLFLILLLTFLLRPAAFSNETGRWLSMEQRVLPQTPYMFLLPDALLPPDQKWRSVQGSCNWLWKPRSLSALLYLCRSAQLPLHPVLALLPLLHRPGQLPA